MKTKHTLEFKAITALKKAVREVVEHHKLTGRPLAIWQDGKVKKIQAGQILRRAR